MLDDTNGIGTISQLITTVLENTGWSLGDCDIFYERDGTTEKVRSIESEGKSGAWQLVQDVCNMFNAYPIYHGDTKTVDIRALANKLPLTELYIGKNLSSLSVETNSENIVTRLYVEGEYGDNGYVGIDDVNPTGLTFLLNFDYYRSIGLFRAEHEEALATYEGNMAAINAQIKAKMNEIMALEDDLNILWGQISYVLLCLSTGQITRTIYGGALLDEQKEIRAGDELLVMPATGNYRSYVVPSGGAVFASNDIYAVKFITLPNGKIGARQIAATAGIDDLEYKADDGLTLQSAMRQAIEYAVAIDDKNQELAILQQQQAGYESAFAAVMGDMLRDGYWSNTNYAPGQEQLLYWDALDQSTEAAWPSVKYSISLIEVAHENGRQEEEFQLNMKVRLLDGDMGVNDVVYVSKVTLCLDDHNKSSIEISNEGLMSTVDSFASVLGRMTYLADIVDQKNKVYDRAKAISSSGQITSYSIADKSITANKLSNDVGEMLDLSDNLTIRETQTAVTNIQKTISQTPVKYGHSLDKPFSFSGANVTFFGDDITYGTKSTGATTTGMATNSWVNRFCTKLSITADNQAANGDTAAQIYSKVAGYSGTPDIIVVACGESDYLAQVAVGTFGDNTVATFYGSLDRICNTLAANFTTSTIIFMTPINLSSTVANAQKALNEYRNAIFEVAASYGYNVVDGSALGFPSDSTSYKTSVIPDGFHPSESGHALLYRSVCGILL